MKKVIIGTLLLASSFAVNAKDYGAAGCGLGSIWFDGQSGLGPHVMAATTNGLYGTQTFAMSSGTLGCDVNGPINANYAALYLQGNMDNVASAIATGHGEALVALADAFKVGKEDRQLFSSTLHDNFSQIYSSSTVTSGQVYSSMIDILSNNKTLAKYAA